MKQLFFTKKKIVDVINKWEYDYIFDEMKESTNSFLYKVQKHY